MDPIRMALAEGPAADHVAGLFRLGASVLMPVGVAALTARPGELRTTIVAVASSPPDALRPLFAAGPGGWELESVTWLAGDIEGDPPQAAYAGLEVFTRLDATPHFMLVIDAVDLWRSFLLDDPQPERLILVDGTDDRVARVLQGQAPLGLLDQLGMIVLPNPPWPLAGIDLHPTGD